MREVARGEPIAGERPSAARRVIGLPSRRSEPVRRHVVVLEAAHGELGSSSRASRSGGRGGGEVDVVLPHRPGDARELVGEGDGRFVVAAEALEVQRPGA